MPKHWACKVNEFKSAHVESQMYDGRPIGVFNIGGSFYALPNQWNLLKSLWKKIGSF